MGGSPPGNESLEFYTFGRELRTNCIADYQTFDTTFSNRKRFLAFIREFMAVILSDERICRRIFETVIEDSRTRTFIDIRPFCSADRFAKRDMLPLVVGYTFQQCNILCEF